MDKVPSVIFESPIKAGAASFIAVSLGYFTIKGIRNIIFKKSGAHSYPPGPPREFLLGAMRSFPKGFPLERFNEWAVAYGDIVYAPVPGMEIVILNSHEIAQELLSKRPGSTAGRRFGYLVSNLIGWEWQLPLLQPNLHHSNQRKMLRKAVGPQRVGSHDPLIESDATKFMTSLSTFKGAPLHLIQQFIGHMVSKATYGDQIWKEMGENLSHWNLEAIEVLSEAAYTFWMVDVFHFLRFIPDWVPGLRFKQVIRECNDLSRKIRYNAYRRGVELYKSGTLGHSILNDLLEEFGEGDDAQDATAILYAVAADTTSAGVIQFLHVLFLFPEVSERVFAEIQTVTQGVRLPRISDRSKMPYTEAVWKEAVRWRTFFPIGLPHVNTQDETIRGYFLPKGMIIHQNTRMMLNDPKVWGDPEVFRPERFLEPSASQRPNPITTLFGWGMRVCPGMHFADRVVFHMVATIISLYKVEPLEGKGLPELDSIEYTPKMLHLPVGFECRFTVRDEKAQSLLRTISLGE
ncbi:cytochrome P450 [Serendipita vermifera]|nr:cytochrome P450 [Serendipita vermifera]